MHMKRIRLLDLGVVTPIRSQTVYHAVAYAMTEATADTVILVRPDAPYVSIGYHQDAEQEVDLAYCRDHGLPVIRREVGGGAVYLDGGQVFVQWVFGRSQSAEATRVALPADLAQRFALFARPLVETYQSLGIPAYFRPVNDIHVDGRKIGGAGAAQIGEAEVLVGSLMFTFDKITMARVLKVSSEKMRDKVFQGLEQYMTTIAEQIPGFCDAPGFETRRQAALTAYLERCAAALDAVIAPGAWSDAEEAAATTLDARFASEEWLLARTRHVAQIGRGRQGVKIHAGVRVVEGTYKAPGGLIRVSARLREDRVDDVSITGDFTMFPAGAVAALEAGAAGLAYTRPALIAGLSQVYRESAIQSPGVTAEDLAEAIMLAGQ
jgi:lipoate-protein ligase A